LVVCIELIEVAVGLVLVRGLGRGSGATAMVAAAVPQRIRPTVTI